MVSDQQFSAEGYLNILKFFIGGDGGIIALSNFSEEGLYLTTKVIKLLLKEGVFIVQLGELLCLLLCEIRAGFTFCQSLRQL